MVVGNPSEYGISLEADGVFNDPHIQYGLHNFDNFGQSFLSVFQIITKDEWTNLLYNVRLMLS